MVYYSHMTTKWWIPIGVLSCALVVTLCLVLLKLNVHAADGSGSASVTPASVRAGTTNAFEFTTTPSEAMSSGEISITVPSDWSQPQGAPGAAGYTTAASSNGTIASVLDTADAISSWSAGTACTNGLAIDLTTKHEGSGSLRCINSDEKKGDRWYKSVTAQNWSAYTKVGFWIRSSAAIANSRLTFAYDNSVNF